MIMTATHTHSAASARAGNRYLPDQPIDDYAKFIIDRIVDGMVCATNNLKPAEIGLGIRQHSPMPATFTISHAGGSFGYLPTETQHALGGYETWLGTNFVQKDAAARISDRLVEMLESLD